MKHTQLPDAEPRCRNRSIQCNNAERCARAVAPLPAKNASVADFSIGMVPTVVGWWCASFEWVGASAKMPAVKPSVKPAVRGIA